MTPNRLHPEDIAFLRTPQGQQNAGSVTFNRVADELERLYALEKFALKVFWELGLPGKTEYSTYDDMFCCLDPNCGWARGDDWEPPHVRKWSFKHTDQCLVSRVRKFSESLKAMGIDVEMEKWNAWP